MKKIIFLILLLLFIQNQVIAGDYGVVKDGFPSWEERTVLVYTNRARSDPVAELKGCNVCADKDCYKTPSKPLTYDYNLNRAARFHCANLISCGGHLQHDSPCTLVSNLSNIYQPNGSCDGSASCACEGGKCGCNPSCTSWANRVSLFGGSPSGENAAYGYSDPVQTFYQWLYEPESNPECGFRYTNGHRVNILNNSHASMGVGNYQSYWTQDFSYSSAYTRRLYSGTHYPKSGKNIEFRANWADSAAPSAASVVIDGIAFEMDIERGSPTNGTYLYKANLPESCHKYYFLFKSSNGLVETFPDEGAYGLNCPLDYYEIRDSVDAGYTDTGPKDSYIDVVKDDGAVIDIVVPDHPHMGDSISEDVIENSDITYSESIFIRDSYPDYVDESDSGCTCTAIY
ncbi:MAG: CAP domain-containing protein [Myxococcota bacterium]